MLQDPDIAIHRLRQRYLTQIQDDAGFRVLSFHEPARHKEAFKLLGGDLEIFGRCVSPDIPTQPESFGTRNGPGRETSEAGDSKQSQSEEASASIAKLRANLQAPAQAFDAVEEVDGEQSISFDNQLYRDHNLSDDSDVSDHESNGSAVKGNYNSRQKHVIMMNLHRKVSADPKGKQVLKVRRRGISDASVSYRNTSVPMVPKIEYNDAFRPGSQSMFSDELSALADERQTVDPVADLDMGLQGAPTSPAMEDFADAFSHASFLAAVAAEDTDSASESGAILQGDGERPGTARPRLDSSGDYAVSLLSKRPLPRSVHPATSGLSLMIQEKQNILTDPLEARFGAFDGKGEPKPLMLKIYRPTGATPSKPFTVCIKPSATVFETIGYALLHYIQSEQQPPLTEEQRDADRWTLRIVEDDGELDEDFPALERLRPISKFSFDEFALVEATAAQVEEYKHAKSTSTPVKPTRTTLDTPEQSSLPVPGPIFLSAKHTSTSLGGTRSNASGQTPKLLAKTPGLPVLLKVRLPTEPGQTELSTILNVTTETYIGDVLDQVCKRRNLDKYMYILRLPGTNVLAPSDRTIESLQGRTELVLARRKAKDVLHDPGTPRSLTPNAPIVAAPFVYSASKLGNVSTIAAANESPALPGLISANSYQRWIVWRRQPMSFMGRHERMLAIDGEYVHISPTESKTMFENAKTSSLHVGQIVVCKQSRRMPSNFKIIIIKQGQTKRYDFEASSSKESETIVAKVKTLMRNTQVTRRLY